MSHDFRFHPSARDELDERIDYYESRRDGLGLELLFEVEATITLICESASAQLFRLLSLPVFIGAPRTLSVPRAVGCSRPGSRIPSLQ